MKQTRLYKNVFDFSVGYDSTDVDDILNIHKYFMEIYAINKCLE